jgi:hypothetical protein
MDEFQKQANLQEAVHALAEPQFRRWAKSQGMVPGSFRGHKNVADVIADAEYRDDLNDALTGSMGNDDGVYRILRGLNVLSGGNWAPQQQARARRMNADVNKVAPFLMTAMPGVWDTVFPHSTGRMTKSIFEANRHSGMTPEQATQLSSQIHQQLYDDPTAARGYSSGEMGDILNYAYRKGLIPQDATPEQAANIASQIGGVTRAMGDSLSAQGHNAPMSTLLQGYGAMPTMDHSDMESQIYQGEMLRRMAGPNTLGPQGDAYMAALRNSGSQPAAGQVAPDTAAAMHAQLVQQAGSSPMGNAAAATVRMVQELGLNPNSPAGQAAAAIQSGQMPFQRHDQFLALMEQSGVDRTHAVNILRQTGTNARYMTPEVAGAVRGGQYGIQVKPQLDVIGRRYPGNDVIAQQNRVGAEDQLAERMGYNSGAHLRQLHGPTAPNTQSVMNQAQQMGQQRADAAHLGRQGPAGRVIGAISDLKPGDQMGVKDIFAQGMGAYKAADAATKAVDAAGTAIMEAVGVKTPEETAEEKKLDKAVQRNMREREARRIARARSKGLPTELVS